MSMRFIFESPIQIIDETIGKPMTVEATLLSEGVTGNGRFYTIEDLKDIAPQCLDKLVFFGTDPMTNEHVNPFRGYPDVPAVGKVVKCWLDETTRKIKAHIEITEEKIKSIVKNLGISIGGIADKVVHMIKNGSRVWRVIGAKIDHIQLIPSGMPRGVEEAKVDRVVDESITFPLIDQIAPTMSDLNLIIKNVPEGMTIKIVTDEE